MKAFRFIILLFVFTYQNVAAQDPPKLNVLKKLFFSENIDTISEILKKYDYLVAKDENGVQRNSVNKYNIVFKRLDWDIASEELLVFVMDSNSVNISIDKMIYISGRNTFYNRFLTQLKQIENPKIARKETSNDCKNRSYYTKDIIYTFSFAKFKIIQMFIR